MLWSNKRISPPSRLCSCAILLNSTVQRATAVVCCYCNMLHSPAKHYPANKILERISSLPEGHVQQRVHSLVVWGRGAQQPEFKLGQLLLRCVLLLLSWPSTCGHDSQRCQWRTARRASSHLAASCHLLASLPPMCEMRGKQRHAISRLAESRSGATHLQMLATWDWKLGWQTWS